MHGFYPHAVDQPLRNDEVCFDSSSSSDNEDLVNREVGKYLS